MLPEEPFKPSVALSVVVEVPDGDELGVKDLAGFFDGDTTGFVGVVVTDGDEFEGSVEGDEESSLPFHRSGLLLSQPHNQMTSYLLR